MSNLWGRLKRIYKNSSALDRGDFCLLKKISDDSHTEIREPKQGLSNGSMITTRFAFSLSVRCVRQAESDAVSSLIARDGRRRWRRWRRTADDAQSPAQKSGHVL